MSFVDIRQAQTPKTTTATQREAGPTAAMYAALFRCIEFLDSLKDQGADLYARRLCRQYGRVVIPRDVCATGTQLSQPPLFSLTR